MNANPPNAAPATFDAAWRRVSAGSRFQAVLRLLRSAGLFHVAWLAVVLLALWLVPGLNSDLVWLVWAVGGLAIVLAVHLAWWRAVKPALDARGDLALNRALLRLAKRTLIAVGFAWTPRGRG